MNAEKQTEPTRAGDLAVGSSDLVRLTRLKTFEAGRWQGMTDAAEIAGAVAPRDMECAPSQNDYYQLGRDAAKKDIIAARDVTAQPNDKAQR
jgi:hypothetical protein